MAREKGGSENDHASNEETIMYDVKERIDSEEEFVNNFPPEKKKKALRKLDWRLTPTLLVLYMVAHLDRANIGNAKIEGMEADLGMSGNDYNVATGLFFVPYLLFELPSNYVLKRYFSQLPSLWIGSLCLSWGIVMTLTGVVTNFQGLIVTRVFLGLTESGFFPGAILLCSSWYVKEELQTRISIFYIASAISGALSGLLAFAIAKMDGISGVEGWRWIFILEGIATVIVAIITFFTLPNAPERSTKWLDEDEIRYFKSRIILQDGGKDVTEHSEFSWEIWKSVLLDWKIYVMGMVYWSAASPIYGLKFTLPQLIKHMGYTSANAQLLSIPPYFVGGFSAWFCSWLSDKFRWRMPFLVVPQLTEFLGFAILLGLPLRENIGACYFAVCLCTAGVYPLTPGVNTWTANNLAGAEKRSLGLGLFISIGNMGGIFGSFKYKNSESPRYETGYGLSIAFCLYGAILSLIVEYVLWKINKKNAKMSKEEVHEKYSNEQLAMLGDKSPLFKYTL